ncbi:MAG: hypothetical protein AB8H80_03555 [Planctomycetota bacterium]
MNSLTPNFPIVRLLAAGMLTTLATAQVANLRITEVDPYNDQVEVTNTGPAFQTAAVYPFCHRFTYGSNIPAGTYFAAGESKTFWVAGLDDADSDLWLYRATPFTVAANIVHGVKYGPAPNIGRSGLAATVGLWPSATAYAPAPASGYTLAYDGYGYAPADWYVDATPSMGQTDPPVVGAVASELAVPVGKETYNSMALGYEVEAITGWSIVNNNPTKGRFNIHAVADVYGSPTPLPTPGADKWLRVRDQDGGNYQNRFYSPWQSTGSYVLPYELSFYINVQELPSPSAQTLPRIVVQHRTPTGVTNAWGIELSTAGAELAVFADGGPAAKAYISPTSYGTWRNVRLYVDQSTWTISAYVDGTWAGSLPIAPASYVDLTELRFCYRGEGVGNVATMMIDDCKFAFGVEASETIRNASPQNPSQLLPGQTSGPVIGQTWDPKVTSSLPAWSRIDFLVLTSPSNISWPFLGGKLLVDPNYTLFQKWVPGGQTIPVPLPNSLAAIGFEFSSQAVAFDANYFELTNAIDAVVGIEK